LKNLLTDISGVRVGHADDAALASGVTAIIFDAPAVASIDVRGGGPGTREESVLHLEGTVDAIDAITLSGGSALGLDAAGGVQAWLAEQGRGLRIRDAVIPIVPGAICFDLLNGGNKGWGRFPPYRDLGYAAARAAGTDFALGSVGAGLGATTANYKGGLGSASAQNRRRRPGRSPCSGQRRWQRHGRRWSVVLGGAVRGGPRVRQPRTSAVFQPRHAEGAAQGRPGSEGRGKHHARRGGDRCGADQAAGQTAGDDRAKPEWRARSIPSTHRSTATWYLRRRPAKSRSIRCSVLPNSAWWPPIRSPAAIARGVHAATALPFLGALTGVGDRFG